MPTLNDKYNDAKKYSKNIMNDIMSLLDKNNIPYTTRSSKTEITITDKKIKKKDINSIIDELKIPDYIISILIKITEVNDVIYIRQITM